MAHVSECKSNEKASTKRKRDYIHHESDAYAALPIGDVEALKVFNDQAKSEKKEHYEKKRQELEGPQLHVS